MSHPWVKLPLREKRSAARTRNFRRGEHTMKQFTLGILFGSLVTGTVVGAGSFYDSKGNVAAPRGSQQQFDYFRQRQQQLDISNMRKQMEQQDLDRRLGKNPC